MLALLQPDPLLGSSSCVIVAVGLLHLRDSDLNRHQERKERGGGGGIENVGRKSSVGSRASNGRAVAIDCH